MHCKKSLNINFLLSLLLALLLFLSLSYAQQLNPEYLYNTDADTTKEKQVQYRRGIVLNENYISYDDKYAGKNLNEEKRRLFPLESTGVWTELNPKVPRVDYLGIQFVNKDSGWAVGDLGALIKSTDGGNNWTLSETNTTTPLLKVRSYNGQILIASGFDGLILRSTDDGETFTQVTSNVTGDLWGLQMLNDTLGWACGNANSLTKTTDGGQTWQRIFTPGYTSDYWWIDFMNESYGFIAANGKVLRTIDGGLNWEIMQAGDSYPLFTIDVIDSLHIAAAGYGGIGYPAKNIYSSDGGNTWINGGTVTTHEINCIKYLNTDTGYIVMSEIGIYKTTNRGQNWNFIPGIEGVGEYEIALLPENVGYSAGTNLKIYKTENGYDYWKRFIINDNFSNVCFVSEQKGFAISWSGISAPSGLYKTINSGINWERVPGAPDGTELLFLDSLTGFIGSNQIYKTTDGGVSWYVPNGGQGGAGKIFFATETIGWAVRSNVIYKTTDRGENWFTQFTALPSIGFNSIHFVDSVYGWTANWDRPFKTIDGGTNWIQQTNLNIWQSRDVFFMDYQNGFLLESNKLFKTTDGGITWVQNQNLTGFSIAKLSTYQDSTIFIIGYKTYRSVDGGENWFEFVELNGTRITGLNLLNNGFGYATGELGLIMKYYDSTYVPVELTSFYSETIDNKVILCWLTASEINNQGFDIEKSKSGSQVWQRIGFVQGKGTTTEEYVYSYTEYIDEPGNYFYRLRQVDYDGSFEYSNIIEVSINSPSRFSLSQNYPNPFNSSTNISYQIPLDEYVTLKVYDILGKEVIILMNENQKAGYYTITFSAQVISSGIYFYKLTAGENSSIKKFILLK